MRTAGWDAEAVRDDLRGSAVAERGDPGGIRAVDETGVVTKGVRSAGGARQDTGTPGKVDNGRGYCCPPLPGLATVL